MRGKKYKLYDSIKYFFTKNYSNMATLYAAKVADNASKPVKEKKPPTEKQLAALAKATAARKRKREESQQQAITEKQQELDDKKEELDAAMEKKRIANEKRKAARLAKKNEEQVPPTPVPEPAPVVKEVIKEVPVKVETTTNNGDAPPNWFRKFAENIVQQKNEVSDVKKPQKAVKIEARELADEKWAQPKVREQVSRNMESHYDKMYSQIFCGRGRA